MYDHVTWDFVRYIISYRRKMAPRVRTLIDDHAGGAQVVILRSRGAARRYLVTVPTSSAAGAVATHEEPG